jgi:hypothetical protein
VPFSASDLAKRAVKCALNKAKGGVIVLGNSWHNAV